MKRIRRLSTRSIALVLSAAFLILLFPIASLLTQSTDTVPSDDKETGNSDSLLTQTTPSPTRTVLVLGKDAVSENTDVVMLGHYCREDNSISVLQIPRDTYLRWNGKEIKLGSLYARLSAQAKKNGQSNPSEHALDSMRELLGQAFSIEINYHLLLDLNTVAKVVDTIGGVEIDVPCDMDYDDPSQNLSIHLKKGKQKLNGEKTLQFLRFRSGYATADLGRLDAQKLLLCALWESASKPFNLLKLTFRISSLMQGVQTNATTDELISLLPILKGTSADKIQMATISGQALYTDDRIWYYILNRAGSISDLNRMQKEDDAVSDSTFDPNLIFTSPNRAQINDIYRQKTADE